MRKADRLFQLVNLIRVHQPVTAAQLAERLQVSVRSVYRYIDDISASGIPVYGEAGSLREERQNVNNQVRNLVLDSTLKCITTYAASLLMWSSIS